MSYYENPSDLYGKSFGHGSPDPGLPKLRSDLVVRRLTFQQDVTFMVKDPVHQAYYGYPPTDWEILRRFDGQHTVEEIVEEYNTAFPREMIDEELVESYIASLKDSDLLEVSTREKSLMLLERMRTQRKMRAEGTGMSQIIMTDWD